ncbi:Multiprotein-bridging factor 1b [Diplonema papillatum]|nr:Multiprotein-bridging factor 1b [Diplonema papillatum]
MSRFLPSGQDYTPVIIGKKAPRPGSATTGPKPAGTNPGETKFVTRSGPHQAAGGKTLNQQFRAGPVTNHKKLDEDHETLKHKTVDLGLRNNLQRARSKKGWSQKELALNCQERETTIKEYENGKAIPNNQVISKMEKALGIHLRGKNAGEEIGKPAAKKAAKPAGKASK